MIFFHSWKVSTLRIKVDLMSHFKMFSDLENPMKSWPNHSSTIFLNLRHLILGYDNRTHFTKDYLPWSKVSQKSKRQSDKLKCLLLSQHGNIHINTALNYKWFPLSPSRQDCIRNFKMLCEFIEEKLAVTVAQRLYYTHIEAMVRFTQLHVCLAQNNNSKIL